MWEPVIWRGGRPVKGHFKEGPRDWLEYNTAPRSAARDGIIGGKPRAFCEWVFALLGAEKGDTLDDLFPGTGAVTAAWEAFTATGQPSLFALDEAAA